MFINNNFDALLMVNYLLWSYSARLSINYINWLYIFEYSIRYASQKKLNSQKLSIKGKIETKGKMFSMV